MLLNLLSEAVTGVASENATKGKGEFIFPFHWSAFILIGIVVVLVTIYCLLKSLIKRKKNNKKNKY